MPAPDELAKPDYATYVDHCRRLCVGRYWRPGDFYGTTNSHEIDDDFDPTNVTFHCINEDVSNEPRDGQSFWIPTLADLLLGMIRIIPDVTAFGIEFQHDKGAWSARATRRGRQLQFEHATPEEAAAQLWVQLSTI